MLSIYGRGFGIGPILGRLGMDSSFEDLTRQARPFWLGIHSVSGKKHLRIAIHLIYGLATSCGGPGNCLDYLDDVGVDLVKQYIRPAAARGWLVILDDQLGRSNPDSEIRRMIARGYMKYDNVVVALDPEFRAASDQQTPGIPVGSVAASELNRAQSRLSRYVAPLHLAHRKIFMVHQFLTTMIANRPGLRRHVPNIDTVIVADGFGDPATKAQVYWSLLSSKHSAGVVYRGIKLFFPNPYETAGHGDGPLMTWRQVFGRDPAVGPDGKRYYVSPAPQAVVIA